MIPLLRRYLPFPHTTESLHAPLPDILHLLQRRLALCLLPCSYRGRILHRLVLYFLLQGVLIWHGIHEYLLDWLRWLYGHLLSCYERLALAVLVHEEDEDGGGQEEGEDAEDDHEGEEVAAEAQALGLADGVLAALREAIRACTAALPGVSEA